ncbi:MULTISPECIES: ribulose-phosphate 3-epimerase [unclassified Breznakia]|uniref:ribulose-phosphate 3-epimerase n=1 Tax=unclassified Breznakia TaxID=2623764 RepID=UPI0024771C42|nr:MULTISPECIES: ribulose-phosphate 3-epimerase [unclassified Breznakia]MDH6367075.1 ribulose-phosphate 3-epimerase [Breznakia sp. PH1-1]MDH6404338.1 ribulose-phosphate 3-epimerase [Breznakia sp. PF1-11]MDH6411962.1 ribulose-phosphate 3-epimerase [Breznakia sp. PFB1-11]MDH6414326.1 ribulose-phosphate 3-epimerase [Breznakia sp. PFB1-14]MDH6416576.1 ribulose-phosphate 3-epimerase [Breznakia sp. PFB1-4]
MKKVIVAPSVLSLDYAKVETQLAQVVKANTPWLHFDVMDGHFVDAITFGPNVLKGFKKATNLFMDVHIMVDQPVKVAKQMIDAGADMITFHVESLDSENEIHQLIASIKKQGCKAGITARPGTQIANILPYLASVDLVLVMSVEPGKGGQSFMPEALDKIAYFDTYRKEHNLNYVIEVDGGINKDTGELCKKAGVDVLVAGSYVFEGDIEERIQSLV